MAALTSRSASDVRRFYRIASAYYDADYKARGYNQDIAFYVKMARASGGPVLEMGCGTGRILLPTARAGIRIHGLDQSPQMLSALRRALEREPGSVRKLVTLSRGDVRTARVKGSFALVTAPFRVAQHLLERADQRAWLRNVARHLAPGGALVFDVFQPNYRLIGRLIAQSRPQSRKAPFVEVDRVDPQSGHCVRRLSHTLNYPEFQKTQVFCEWIETNASGRRVRSIAGSFMFRWFTRGELENLLELEGFRITDFWGSFRPAPHGAGSEHQIIRAVRAAKAGSR